jgi:hypothetical protein
MKQLVKEITAYRYNELEEYAQEKAKENYLAEERLPEFFSEDLIYELQEQFGLGNLQTYYSLSNNQGDGLCLYGKISHTELFENDKFKKIAFKGIHYKQIQSVKDELQGIDFEHRSNYYHLHTVNIESHEYNLTSKQANIVERIINNVKSWYASFCRDWEKRGYAYFYEISDEDMQEICDANDYLFTARGRFINQDEYMELTV